MAVGVRQVRRGEDDEADDKEEEDVEGEE